MSYAPVLCCALMSLASTFLMTPSLLAQTVTPLSGTVSTNAAVEWHCRLEYLCRWPT